MKIKLKRDKVKGIKPQKERIKKSRSGIIKLTIGKKISLGFIMVIVIFSLSTLYTYNTIKDLNEGYKKLINEITESVMLAEGMKADTLEKVQYLSQFIITGDKKNFDSISEVNISFNEKEYKLEKLLDTDESKNALKELSENNYEYNNLVEEIKALLENKEDGKVMELMSGKGTQIVEDISMSADTIVRLAEVSLDKGTEEQLGKGEAIIANLLFLTAVTIIISILLSFYISGVVSKPVAKLSAVAEKVAEGNLTGEGIHIRNKDEIGDLAQSFNKMLSNLKSVVDKTMQSSYEVAASSKELMAGSETASSASEQILSSVQNASGGIQNQKFSIDSISSAMEETSAEIQQIAANMQQVSSNAQGLNELSDRGYKALGAVIEQMEKISTSSKESVNAVKSLETMSQKVQTIISMITDVSSQTNLLALNAAIEAARAGEQGRGFSVVAEEVRKLAEQSGSAAKEISDTIKAMNGQIESIVSIIEDEALKVNTGTEVVSQANSSFEEISKGVGSILSQVQEISSATQQITSGIEQVVAATGEIMEAAANNSASMEEVSLAIEEQTASMEKISDKASALAELAAELEATVSVFKVS
ncbi:MAG: methyl-accepting chemotaxis protein [Clostridiaceae bacterium]|nr:methyl-accepting chemotaxis protein [Clostridiaceae bacterium]